MSDNGLSPEMNEAIRILREDHQIAAFNSLTASNQAVIQRLDAMEEERKKPVEPTDPPKDDVIPPVPPTPPTPPTSIAPVPPTDPNNPPPRIEPTPTPDPPKGRRRWNEGYPS